MILSLHFLFRNVRQPYGRGNGDSSASFAQRRRVYGTITRPISCSQKHRSRLQSIMSKSPTSPDRSSFDDKHDKTEWNRSDHYNSHRVIFSNLMFPSERGSESQRSNCFEVRREKLARHWMLPSCIEGSSLQYPECMRVYAEHAVCCLN